MEAAAFLVLIQRKAGDLSNIKNELVAEMEFMPTSGETTEGRVASLSILATGSGNGAPY